MLCTRGMDALVERLGKNEVVVTEEDRMNDAHEREAFADFERATGVYGWWHNFKWRMVIILLVLSCYVTYVAPTKCHVYETRPCDQTVQLFFTLMIISVLAAVFVYIMWESRAWVVRCERMNAWLDAFGTAYGAGQQTASNIVQIATFGDDTKINAAFVDQQRQNFRNIRLACRSTKTNSAEIMSISLQLEESLSTQLHQLQMEKHARDTANAASSAALSVGMAAATMSRRRR